jgi:hypothetical protein
MRYGEILQYRIQKAIIREICPKTDNRMRSDDVEKLKFI